MEKIRVGFLTSGFSNRHGSGTAKVVEKLIKILCNEFEESISVTLFCNNASQYNYLVTRIEFSNAQIQMLPNVWGNFFRSSRQYYKYSLLHRKYKVDIMHFSAPRLYPFFWLFPSKKFICTFHAGGEVTAPRDSFILSREIYNLIAKKYFMKLDSIIAVSEFGKREIATAYGIPSNFVRVIHPGTDDNWILRRPNPIRESDKEKIVVVGRWQRYKNVQVVSESLSLSDPELLKPYFFIFLGRQISSNAAVISAQLSNLQPGSYQTIEFLEDNDYLDTLRQASLVIVPSINEGFSLPVFDAYGAGCRVLLHHPSPASEILSGMPGVLAADLSNSTNFMNVFFNALTLSKSKASTNQKYLRSIGATWQGMTENYVSEYRRILGGKV